MPFFEKRRSAGHATPLDTKPELDVDDTLYWNAFNVLIGSGLRFADIILYCRLKHEDDWQAMLDILMAMKAEYDELTRREADG